MHRAPAVPVADEDDRLPLVEPRLLATGADVGGHPLGEHRHVADELHLLLGRQQASTRKPSGSQDSHSRPISFGAAGAREHLLTPGTPQQVEVLHSLLDGGGHGGEELYPLDCETEFVYVVGRLDLVLADETVTLGAGDAMTPPGRTPHTWRNSSATKPCEVLRVLSPAP